MSHEISADELHFLKLNYAALGQRRLYGRQPLKSHLVTGVLQGAQRFPNKRPMNTRWQCEGLQAPSSPKVFACISRRDVVDCK